MPSSTVSIDQDSWSALKASVPIVGQYFETFNQGQFQQTASLFAETGGLYPPFETPVMGPECIGQYLVAEAEGMIAEPMEAESTQLADGRLQVKIRGKVQALVFKVPVSWRFVLTANAQIDEVHVSLLASLEELMAIRPEAAERYGQ